MKPTKNNLGSPILCSSQTFSIEYGEKVDDYFFSPLRKYTFTKSGVRRWYWPHLVARPNDGTGFAALNVSDDVASHENIFLPPGKLVLVAHSFETIAARIQITIPGTYFIVALFSPVNFEGPYHINLSANGIRLWEATVSNEACKLEHAHFVHMASTGFVDFAINTDRVAQTVPSRAFIQYAVIRCDDRSGAIQVRVDDRSSDLPEKDIIALHAQTAFTLTEIAAPNIDDDERAALFLKEWSLRPEYVSSQYQCSAKELVERVSNNRTPASIKYCIFMIPRSGSTLLTELLSSTGSLGFPGESFVPDVIRTLSLTFLDLFPSYEDLLLCGLQSDNGVFGIEVEHERLQEEHRFFADLTSWRHIYIWRKDLLAQAISYQISIDTGVWHSFVGSAQDDELRYIPRSTIIEKINSLLKAERFFRDFFAENQMTPYSISFEELMSDQILHVRKIADHIGIDSATLNFVDEQAVMLRPTSRARNAYYKQLTICCAGELWGYDIHAHGNGWVAVLHGVDLGLLDLDSERLPVLFVAEDRTALWNRVDEFVVEQIASLPAIEHAK